MKKNIIIVTISVLVIILGYLAYSGSKQLQASTAENYELKETLEDATKTNEALEDVVDALKDKVALVEGELTVANSELQLVRDQVQEIDQSLVGEGSILERIETLKSDNSQWREALNELSLDLNELQSEQIEASEQAEVAATLDLRIGELKDIEAQLDDRVLALEEAVANLSKLSLERIMVEQEVKFLEARKLDIIEVRNNLMVE